VTRSLKGMERGRKIIRSEYKWKIHVGDMSMVTKSHVGGKKPTISTHARGEKPTNAIHARDIDVIEKHR
jgi:hypothetical protein